MKTIQLRLADGNGMVWIVAANILYIMPMGAADYGAIVHLVGGEVLRVQETPDMIGTLIGTY